ncbi:MAG: LamG domain-containing protein [Candidatus Paceibacterota bacterium]|jgi:hypothetical protein
MKNLSIQKNKNCNFGGSTSKKGIFFVFAFLFFSFYFSITSAATVKSVGNSGLVGYWPLNDGAGTKANDMSGNGNTGTFMSTPLWTSGKIGKALSFNGSSSYIRVANSSSLNPINLTVSAWAKSATGTWNDYGFIVSKRNVYIIHPAQNLTSVNFYIYTTGWVAVTCTPSVPITNWNLYTLTWNGTNLTAYINGTQCNTAVPGGIINTTDTNELNIGKDAGLSRYFNGSIDDVRIYSRALSASEIKTLYQFGSAQTKVVSNSGLVGYWPFNDGAGSKANDMSGSGNTAATTSSSLVWVAGKNGKAVNLNGATYLSGNGSALPNVGTAGNVTLSAWIKPNTVVGQGTIFSKGASGSCFNYGIVIFGSGLRGRNSTNDHALGGTIVANQWQHVAVVYSASGMEGFVNGVSVGTSVNTTTTCANNNWAIGTRAYNAATSEFFNGLVDELRVYNRALSATEIQQLYKQNATQVNASTNNFLNNGLVYVFSLNGGDISWGSNTAYDRSGQGNNATLVSFSTTSSPATGKLGQGLKFNGVSTYLNTPAMAFLGQASATFSVSVWVKPRVVGGTIIHNMNESVGWSTGLIGFHLGKLSYNIYANGFADSPNTAVAGRWLLVSFTRDGVTGVNKLYENGVLVKTTTTGYSPSGGSHKFTLGRFVADCCQMDSPGWFDGVMDDYRLYNRVLSDTEVKQLYNMGR